MSKPVRSNNNVGDFFTNLTNNSKPVSDLAYNFNAKPSNTLKSSNTAKMPNAPAKNSSPFSSIFGLFKSPKNSPTNTSTNIPTNTPTNTPTTTNSQAPHISSSMTLFIVFSLLAILLIYRYYDEIFAGISNIGQNIRSFFDKPAAPPIDASDEKPADVTSPPYPPQDDKILKASGADGRTIDIIDKLIPYGNPEVFNISKNEFTYYDAEPLCKALGAELATYDQVKEAYGKGADWCNYGWVKGQAAVYPTQKETWDRVQSGPEGTQDSCGVPGLNGGYFDNPELKFGVNCYGVKPHQSEHDQEMLMMKGRIPLGVPALEVDRKIQEFRKEASDIGIMPFNTGKWSTI